MAFKVAVVGRPRDPAIASAIKDYEERASRYWPLSFHELRISGTRSASLPPATIKLREAEKLMETVSEEAQLVACDETGTEMNSRQFASWLTARHDSASHVVFVVGGAYGLDNRVRSSASMLLSLSRFTLPHDLARLVLAEQLYRAGTIARREPYHK